MNTTATELVQHHGSSDLTVPEVKRRIDFVKQVMKEVMNEGQDYGKIPGCPKPSLLQPGAQKLALTFQLNVEVRQETTHDMGRGHREYAFVIKVSHPSGKFAEGVGSASTMEEKYRYRKEGLECPTCGQHAIARGREEWGGGWYCSTKKGGCGAKFDANEEMIVSQKSGKVEHDNPADYYNTIRKMAFKRAQVHGIINFTNTSELWSQDLEDFEPEHLPPTPPAAKDRREPPARAEERPRPEPAPAPETVPGEWENVVLHFGKNRGTRLGALHKDSLRWYIDKWEPKEWPEGSGKFSAQDIALRKALNQAGAPKQTSFAESEPKAEDDVTYV